MLEVRAVVGAGRPDDDRGLLLPAGRRDLLQSGPQQRRVVIDRPHAVVLEQRRQQARHRPPVLEHVGDAGRRAHVVLQHLPRAVGVAHEIAPAHVAVDAAGRADAVRGAGEGGAGDDQLPRHLAVVDDLARVVDVIDEVVQRTDALGQAALDLLPLVGRDDPRHQVQRERAVLDRAGARGAGVERDPLLHEDRVTAAAGLRQGFGSQRLQRRHERARMRARPRHRHRPTRRRNHGPGPPRSAHPKQQEHPGRAGHDGFDQQ